MKLTQFLRILWVWRRIIIGCAALFLVAGTVFALVRHRTYTAEARVMLDVLKPDPVTGDVISSSFARAYVPTQTELIKDTRVTGRVVDKSGMLNSPQLKAQYEASGNHNTEFRRWLADRISESTEATNVPGSNVIVISYSGDNPVVAANVANLLRDSYVEETLDSKRSDAAKTAGFFERQLVDVRNQLTAAEARMVAFEKANNIVLLAEGSDADTAHLQAVASASPPPAMMTSGGGGVRSSGGGEQLAAIDAKIAAASATLGPNNPVLQDLRAQRAAAAAASRSAGVAAPASVRVVDSGGDIAGARAHVLAQSDKVEEAKRYESDVKVLRDQYAKMAARAADLHQQAASNESGISLLDSAVEPHKPDAPATPLIILGALAAGLGLGLVIALGVELLHRRVRGVDDLTGLQVPLIGVIGGVAASG